jgi:hypothetical protein
LPGRLLYLVLVAENHAHASRSGSLGMATLVRACSCLAVASHSPSSATPAKQMEEPPVVIGETSGASPSVEQHPAAKKPRFEAPVSVPTAQKDDEKSDEKSDEALEAQARRAAGAVLARGRAVARDPRRRLDRRRGHGRADCAGRDGARGRRGVFHWPWRVPTMLFSRYIFIHIYNCA